MSSRSVGTLNDEQGHMIKIMIHGIVAPDLIKMLVGHSEEGMTDHYTHMSFVQLSMLRDALEKLDFRPLLKGIATYRS